MAQSNFSIDVSQVLNGLVNYQAKTHAAITMYAETGAKKMEAYAKKNRPWTDQTGVARASLHGYTEDKGDKIRCCIAHGVEYGVYLEYAHEQRFAILEPTVMEVGVNEILPGMARMLERLK